MSCNGFMITMSFFSSQFVVWLHNVSLYHCENRKMTNEIRIIARNNDNIETRLQGNGSKQLRQSEEGLVNLKRSRHELILLVNYRVLT